MIMFLVLNAPSYGSILTIGSWHTNKELPVAGASLAGAALVLGTILNINNQIPIGYSLAPGILLEE